MHFNAASTLAVAATLATTVSAHTLMWGVSVNGVEQGTNGNGEKKYIRTPPSNSPVVDVTSPDVICNVAGGTKVPEFVSAVGGDTITTEWYHDNRDTDIIDGSHVGPIITYIAPYFEDNGASAEWSKIGQMGFDASKPKGSQWAVDYIKANHGKSDVVLPNLAPGKYMLRQEIIALHEGDRPKGAQFYPACVQLEIGGSGSVVPDQGFKFIGGYSATDPGILFNVYGGATSYTIPGPAVFSGAGGSAPAPAPARTSTAAAAPAPTSTLATVVVPTSSAAAAPATSAAPAPSSAPVTPPTNGNTPAKPCTRRRRRSVKAVRA